MNRNHPRPKNPKPFAERQTPMNRDKEDVRNEKKTLAERAHDPDVVVPPIMGAGPSIDVDTDDQGVASALTDIANNYIVSHYAPVDGGDRKPGQTAKV